LSWLELVGLALFVSLYFVYRARFAGLPLHVDSGFYVTNAAIVERRYRPLRGWNAHFSGNSRLLPEWCHSTLYLRVGPARYAAAFRALYAGLALIAALSHGAAASALLGTHAAFWWTALISAALLAEVQYGGYFESAEAFEVAVQGLGLAGVCWGAAHGCSWLGALGLACFWLDALLIKSSAALPAVLVSALLLVQQPALRGVSAGLGALAAVGLWRLLRAAPGGARQALFHLRKHEAYVRRNYRSPWLLLAVKLGFTAKQLAQEPALAALAFTGVLLLAAGAAPTSAAVLSLHAAFGAGALGALLVQGNRVWYYALPLLGLLGAAGAACLLWLARAHGELAAAVCGATALLTSLLVNLRKLRGRDLTQQTWRVFSVYDRPGHAFGRRFAEENCALMQACQRFHARVRGQSLLVLGEHNQAYLQLEAAYVTPLVSLCELARAVAGELSPYLPKAPERPRYVLDTIGALPTECFGLEWLGTYRQIDSFGRIRLFERQPYRG
jgi:hypothetical protein